MRLVDDDDAVKILSKALEQTPVFQHANRAEQMVMALRFMVAHQEITEVRVAKNSPISEEGLFEDFLAMRGEKQARPLTKAVAFAFVIKGGDNRFSSSCGSHDKISAITSSALAFQGFKNSLLKSMRLDFKEYHRHSGIGFLLRVADGFPQDFWPGGVERNEFPAVPVCLKFDPEFFNDVGLVLRGDFQIPLETLGHCGIRHVGRADVSRGKSRLTMEVVGFCVESSALRVIGNANLRGGKPGDPFDGSCIRSSHVGSRDQADRHAAIRKLAQ